MNKTRYSHASSRSDAVYPYFIFPDKGTAIYPYRRSGIPATPVEKLFAGCLEKALAASSLEVITGGGFKFADGGYTYRASILLCDRENKGVAIDVEIDEPYTLPDFTPRHYIEDSSDSLRDSLLTARGWAVVRFAEKQPPFRWLKLPKRTREKRIFRYLRNLTTVKSDGCDKD